MIRRKQETISNKNQYLYNAYEIDQNKTEATLRITAEFSEHNLKKTIRLKYKE